METGHETQPDLTQLLFVQFLLAFGINVAHPSVDDVGAFAELLIRSGRSASTVRNYLSAIRQFTRSTR